MEPKMTECGVAESSVLVGSRLRRWVAVERASTQKGANNIISRANNAFSFTVLGGGVGTGHAQVDAVGQEERAGTGVIELFAVVALDCLDGDAELGLHMSEKVSEGGIRVRLKA